MRTPSQMSGEIAAIINKLHSLRGDAKARTPEPLDLVRCFGDALNQLEAAQDLVKAEPGYGQEEKPSPRLKSRRSGTVVWPVPKTLDKSKAQRPQLDFGNMATNTLLLVQHGKGNNVVAFLWTANGAGTRIIVDRFNPVKGIWDKRLDVTTDRVIGLVPMADPRRIEAAAAVSRSDTYQGPR